VSVWWAGFMNDLESGMPGASLHRRIRLPMATAEWAKADSFDANRILIPFPAEARW
jgi:hypothetical protein